MPLSYEFDATRMFEDLKQRLIVVMNELINDFAKTAMSNMSAEARADTEVEKAVVEGHTDYEGDVEAGTEYINARCWFYANAILESYGIGSLADTSHESYWEDYKQSGLFNPERRGKYITGRPAGSYTDIWGNPQESMGTMEGVILEGLTINGEKVKPKAPSRAIQAAETWLIKNGETRMERTIKTEIERFFIEEASNYIIQTGSV